jgi:hypothetical protein
VGGQPGQRQQMAHPSEQHPGDRAAHVRAAAMIVRAVSTTCATIGTRVPIGSRAAPDGCAAVSVFRPRNPGSGRRGK